MRTVRLILAAAALALTPALSPACADQTDPRLNELFDALALATTEQAATPIEEQIWSIWQESDSPTAELLYVRSSLSAEAGQLDVAQQLLDTLIQIRPDFAEGWNMRATLHVMRDDYPAAIKDIEKTLALEPRHFAALSGLGQILMSRGEDKAALNAFDQALKINPSLASIKTQAETLRRKLQGQPI